MKIAISVISLFIYFQALAVESELNSSTQMLVRVGAFQVPRMIESADKGLFVELLRKICERNQYDCRLSLFPRFRMMHNFQNQELSIFMPGNAGSFTSEDLKSIPFFKKQLRAWVNSKLVIKNISDLEGKKVGIVGQYIYPENILKNSKIHFIRTTSDTELFHLLEKNRIEVALIEELSGTAALQKLNLQGVTFNKEVILGEQPIYFVIRNNSEGQKLRLVFDKTLNVLKNEGYLRSLFGDKSY